MHEPANSNTSFRHPPVDIAFSMARRAADARHLYQENAGPAVEAALRASPDFAPAFAEPGEMTARERTEEALAERGYVPILAGFGIAAAFATIAIIAVAIARGNL